MIQNIIVQILTKLGSWLFAKVLEFYHGKQEQKNTDEDIDNKLNQFKEAYKEAFDGQPITPEQRKKLNQSIADFIRNPNVGGL